MEEVILRRGLKMIKEIFEQSTQSQDPDLFRIPDIINSLDEKQIQSKQWLVDTLASVLAGGNVRVNSLKDPIATEFETIVIGGGWYGLLGYLLKLKFPDSSIVNTDIDENAIVIAEKMFPEITHEVIDMVNENYYDKHGKEDNWRTDPWDKSVPLHWHDRTKKDLHWRMKHKKRVFISTSIEHIHVDDVDSILFYNPNKTVALQSNNFFDHPSHINCSETLDDFKEYISPMLKEVYYAGELYLDDYTRFMIIGKT